MNIKSLLPVLFLSAASLASAQNVIVNGSFENSSAGAPVPKPWIVASQITKGEGVVTQVDALPDSTDGKLWLHIRDENPELPGGTVQNFPEVKSGTFSCKIYFQKVGTAFGIYIGAPKVSAPETRVIDFKVLSGGKLSLGEAGVRSKAGFVFVPGKVYTLNFEFETSADGSNVTYKVTTDESADPIATGTIPAKNPIAGLRIATDSKDKETDVYVTDISITPKN